MKLIDKRKRAAQVAYYSGLSGFLRRRSLHREPVLRILTYHRVLAELDENSYPCDPELISTTAAMFAWQMEHLRENYHPVSCRQILEYLRAGEPLPRNAVLVTFDDGFEDNYSVAFPILKRLGVPATVFVVTGNVDHGEPFWFSWLASMVWRAPAGTYILPGIDQEFVLRDEVSSRRQITKSLLSSIKKVSDGARQDVLDALRARLPHLRGNGIANDSRVMSWEQIREMSESVIDVGSHTVTHPVLAKIDAAQLLVELQDSWRRLCEQVPRSLPVMAYPVGTVGTFNEPVKTAVRDTGYELGFTYVAGVNPVDMLAAERFSLRRLSIERSYDRSLFASLLAQPSWFGR